MAAKRIQDVRGRVVLRMRGGSASPLVLEAAVRVARAFQGELRGLFVEDEELLSLADFPFAREISLSGGRTRLLSSTVMRREMQAARAAMTREFERLKRAARIPTRFEVVQGSAEDVLRRNMEETGILAIGEPLALAGGQSMSALLAELSELAGIVVAGAQARRAQGPLLTVLDPSADVGLLVDTAERIAGEGAHEIILAVAATDPDEAARLEAQALQALDPGTRYRFERLGEVSPRSVRALARQNESGLVIARAGGPVVEDSVQAMRMACSLDCPLLLLR